MIELGKIKEGTVLDHITAGRGVKVIEALKLVETGKAVSLIANAESKKLGKKDLIKIEDKHLDPKEVKAKIGNIAPRTTVNWIKNSEVVKKVRLAEI